LAPGSQPKINVEFFPEGGELVADVLNRIYFRARTALGEPAEFEGRIRNAQGKEVATIKTTPDKNNPGQKLGLGVFTLIPEAGQKYTLEIPSPKGGDKKHPGEFGKDKKGTGKDDTALWGFPAIRG